MISLRVEIPIDNYDTYHNALKVQEMRMESFPDDQSQVIISVGGVEFTVNRAALQKALEKFDAVHSRKGEDVKNETK